MTRPILLQAMSSGDANESCGRFADVFGVQPAGVELALPTDAWTAIVAGDDESEPYRVNDSRYAIRALAAVCTETDIEQAIEGTTRLLKLASDAGAAVLSLTIPPLACSSGTSGFARYRDALSFAYHLFRAIRPEAAAKGVAMALEAACGGCFLSPVELRELIDSVNSWAIGACVDVARVSAIGSPSDWIATLTRRVRIVRWSIDSVNDRSSTGISDEALDHVGLAGALDAIDANAPIVLPRGITDMNSLRELVFCTRKFAPRENAG